MIVLAVARCQHRLADPCNLPLEAWAAALSSFPNSFQIKRLFPASEGGIVLAHHQ
jgi:hypothetical protein